MLGDMASVKKNYIVVQQENGSLIGEYLQRRNNHEELVKSLKELNNFIRKASNLRLGPSKGLIVSKSREAIKAKKTIDVVKICLGNGPK
mmetsp:Transcript_30605/g.30095  ORF Transcript_30605/g.30095 Transcript_30605/m.30095 type:complete len:89 (+) Transcript_30605:986-1252(+)